MSLISVGELKQDTEQEEADVFPDVGIHGHLQICEVNSWFLVLTQRSVDTTDLQQQLLVVLLGFAMSVYCPVTKEC